MRKNWPEIIKILRESGSIENPDHLDPKVAFAQLGIDSIDLAGILLAIEDQFAVRLLDDPGKRPKSFADILDLIDKTEARLL
ncbi:MAG: phosphopantetheine-binding protein [Bdellovibrionota bacterium]